MSRTHKLVTAISVLILAILACARASTQAPPTIAPSARPPQPSPAVTPNASPVPLAALPGLKAGQSSNHLNFAGVERNFILYVPASADLTKPVALVFAFHGGTGNAEQFMKSSGLNEVADQNGFLLIYPNGTGRFSDDKLLTWNGGTCCGYAVQQAIDDVGFVHSIINTLHSQVQIDMRRVYATGFSNGAILTQRLACQAADLFAAIAPVSGTLNFSPCKPSRPVSVIEIHGTADPNILYTGGYGPESIARVNFAAVADTLKFWSGFDGCGAPLRATPFADVQHDTWAGCVGSTSVELYTIVGGKHTWPRAELSAPQVIWAFFAAHPRP